MQVEKTKDKQSDPTTRILESKDILDGMKARVDSVDIETRLRKVRKVQAEFDTDGQVAVAEDVDSEWLSDDQYVSDAEIESAMSSIYAEVDFILEDTHLKHVNQDTIQHENKVVVHSQNDAGEDQLYVCQVENIVRLTVTDRWANNRTLVRTFEHKVDAEDFGRYLKELRNEKVSLTHNDQNYIVEPADSDVMSEGFNIDHIKKPFALGFITGLTSTVLGFSLFVTFAICGLIALLNFMDTDTGHKKQTQYHLPDEEMEDVNAINVDRLLDYSVTDEMIDQITIEISDENINLLSDTLDTEWKLDKMSNKLLSSDSVEFFEEVGIENIDGDTFTATVQRRTVDPKDGSIESVCGEWYLYPNIKGRKTFYHSGEQQYED